MPGPLGKMRIIAFPSLEAFSSLKNIGESFIKSPSLDGAGSVLKSVSGLVGGGLKGAIGVYEVMFNPESYHRNYSVSYKVQQPTNSTKSQLQFDKVTPEDLSFEFIIDGTGATGESRNVFLDIQNFFFTTGFYNKSHEPKILMLNWGTLVFKCVLKSADVAYSLFDSNGLPLRATIKATFSETITAKERALKEDKQSPDLSEVVVVNEGDTLPLLAEKIYGDASLYVKVAEVNQLTNFRRLTPGTELLFPPVEQMNV